jgi:hypothetical protein
VNVVGLMAGGRIGYLQAVFQFEAVAAARGRSICDRFMPALLEGRHRQRLAIRFQHERNLALAGCPQAKAYLAVRLHLCSEGHLMNVFDLVRHFF